MDEAWPDLAISYFQRLYVMHGRWRDWVAKTYYRSGEAFEKLDDLDRSCLPKPNLTPVSAPADDYLHVAVTTKASCFTISISFERRVFYRSGGKWLTTIGRTWDRSVTGIAEARAAIAVDYILDGIAQYVEVFCNEFLKANGK